MAFASNFSENNTFNLGNNTRFPFKCVELPITIGNDTICGNLTKWESRYSPNTLKAMVLVPAILALANLCFRLWRSKSAIHETYEDLVNWEKHMFEARKKKKLERTESTISDIFHMYQVEFDIKGKLNCFERCLQGVGDRINVTDLGLRFNLFKTFISIEIVSRIKQIWEAVDVILDCFLLYQLESGQIFDTMVHRNIHVTNAIYAFIWISLLFQLCACDCCSLGQFEMLAKDMKSFILFFIIGGPELILEYFYMDKFVSRKTDWYLFVRSSVQFLMAILTIYSAIQNSKRTRMIKEDDMQQKLKFCSYMMIPIALASMCRVIGSTYQYTTGKVNRSCFTLEQGKEIYQSPFDSGCMRGVDYLIIILTFTPLGVLQIILIVVITWFRLNPNSPTLKKYFFDDIPQHPNLSIDNGL